MPPVSWQVLIMIISIAASVSFGAIWLGTESKQIDVNTTRLDRIERHLDDILQHDADTTAREASMERRLDRLENNGGH